MAATALVGPPVAGKRCVWAASFFAPRGLAGLGWGLPAAIGVATAMRQSESTGRVVCLAGDGGWGYSMADVETASRLGLPIVTVILNNSTLGRIKHSAEGRYPGEMVSEDFLDVEYSAATHGMGACVENVDAIDRFESAFGRALEDSATRPWVIEARSCAIETPVLQAHVPPKTHGGY